MTNLDEGFPTRFVVGRMAESVQGASSQAADVLARPDKWIEGHRRKYEQLKEEIQMTDSRNTDD